MELNGRFVIKSSSVNKDTQKQLTVVLLPILKALSLTERQHQSISIPINFTA